MKLQNNSLGDLRPMLEEAIARFGVPGASFAAFHDGCLDLASAGFANLATGVEATSDTIFQIGSITKPVTATMAMQLVEEGRLNLDAPVREVLPDFRVGDEAVSAKVTARHLLTHSSGIDGDMFLPTRRGEDAVAHALELGRGLQQLHPLGDGFSYCNFGFAVLGRMIEVLDGIDWDTSLARRIAGPLGTPSFVTRAEDCLRHRVAVGHMKDKDGRLVPAAQPYLSFGMGPAGATPAARAVDLIQFARAHFEGGGVLLGREAAAAMREPHNEIVNGGPAEYVGLGFFLSKWNEAPLFGHDGATIGQNAFLRIHPESGTVFALLANGGDMQGLAQHVMESVFGEVCRIAPPRASGGTSDDFETARYAGVYGRRSTRLIVAERDAGLTLTVEQKDDWAKAAYGTQGPFPLRSVDGEVFAYRPAGLDLFSHVRFMQPGSDGRFGALHAGLRLNLRTGQSGSRPE
jgi:CubicO group peptidase (beta-lactamase class C family)